MPWSRLRVLGLFALCEAALIAGAAAVTASSPEALQAECEYGVTLALEGKLEAADSVFVSLLAHSPGDPRALANLGNLSLLHGERETALKFYELAARADSVDAGIRLNCAITLYLMGNDEEAHATAAEAVARAGGNKSVEALLGLRNVVADDQTPKAADMSAPLRFPLKRPGGRILLSRAELRALVTPGAVRPTKRPVSPHSSSERDTSNLASAVSGSYETNAAAVLYWKR